MLEYLIKWCFIPYLFQIKFLTLNRIYTIVFLMQMQAICRLYNLYYVTLQQYFFHIKNFMKSQNKLT